jgi:hypothetical protein
MHPLIKNISGTQKYSIFLSLKPITLNSVHVYKKHIKSSWWFE